MSKRDPRPLTPEKVKRQLRQEAGFGCCKCGLPIYQYHHIIQYGNDHHFRPIDMMILCPTHHDEATKGAMLEEEQRYYKTHPFNLERGSSSGLLKVNQRVPWFQLGSNLFDAGGKLLQIDDSVIVGVRIADSGIVLISVELRDKNDSVLLKIIDNEWISGDPMPWDIVSDFQKLEIRKKMRDISLAINAQSQPILFRANLWKNGRLINISEHTLAVDVNHLNTRFVRSQFHGCFIHLNSVQNHVTVSLRRT